MYMYMYVDILDDPRQNKMVELSISCISGINCMLLISNIAI